MGLLEDYFNEKLFVVSGVGTGQGLSTVKLLSAMGAHVIALSRHGRSVTTYEDEMRNVDFQIMDATSEESIELFAGRLRKEDRIIDGIVNNTGIWEPSEEKNVSPGKVTEFFKSNTLSQYNVIYHMIPLVRRGGSVVNIGAARSLFSGNHSAYTISKFAIEEVTRSFASEYRKHGVRVNAILPGSISKEDNFSTVFPFNFNEKGSAMDPLNISYITAFLLSPMSHAINGQCISADRGVNI